MTEANDTGHGPGTSFPAFDLTDIDLGYPTDSADDPGAYQYTGTYPYSTLSWEQLPSTLPNYAREHSSDLQMAFPTPQLIDHSHQRRMDDYDPIMGYQSTYPGHPSSPFSLEIHVRRHLDALDGTIASSHEELDLGAIRQRLHTMVVRIDSLVGRPPSNLSPNPSQVEPRSMESRDTRNSNGHKALYRCALCSSPYIYTGKGTFRRHITSHRAPIYYRCYVEGCGKTFIRKDQLAHHLRARHEKSETTCDLIIKCQVSESPTSCDICHTAVNSFGGYFECMCAHCRIPPDSSSLGGDHGPVASHPAPRDLGTPVTGTWHEGPLLGPSPSEAAESSLSSRGCFTESGYVGGRYRGQQVPQYHCLGQTQVILEGPSLSHLPDGPAIDGSKLMESKDDDEKTIHSEMSSISEPVKENYIAELAEDIARATRPFQPNKDVLERISKALPLLLKAFALSLGHASSSQMHRDVMVFLHKHRL